METFHDKLILLLIDKVAIGALIGFASLCAAILLEKFKATYSFRKEVGKTRVEKIGELWKLSGQAFSMLMQAQQRKKAIWHETYNALKDDSKRRMVAYGEVPPEYKTR